MVKKIGFKTQGEETLNICYLVFFSQFLNSVFLVILVGTNFKNTPLEFLSFMGFDGEFNHMTEEWYNSIGKSLVFTQITQAFLPYYNSFKVIIISRIKI